MEVKAKIKNRIDTLENWETENPILENGEIALVKVSDERMIIKIGNGSSSFNDLPYVSQNYINRIIFVSETQSINENMYGNTLHCTNSSVIELTLPSSVENGWYCNIELESTAKNVTVKSDSNIIFNSATETQISLGAPNLIQFVFDGTNYHAYPQMLQKIVTE